MVPLAHVRTSSEEQLQDEHHHESPLFDPDYILTAGLSQAGH